MLQIKQTVIASIIFTSVLCGSISKASAMSYEVQASGKTEKIAQDKLKIQAIRNELAR